MGRSDGVCESGTVEQILDLSLEEVFKEAERRGKIAYHMGWSRGFRMLMALGVAVAVISTLVLVALLLRNQRMINKARSEIEFMKMRESTATSIGAARVN